MLKRLLIPLLVLAALAVLLSAPALAENKVAVAIMTFKEGQLSKWWGWDWDLEEGVTNLVTDEVVKRGTLDVVERSRISEIMNEQNLGDGGRVEADTASKIGKLLGARLMVLGTITEWTFKQSGGIGLFGVSLSGSQAKVTLTGRVVDTETARILTSFQGEGSKVGASFNVNNFNGISLNGKQFEGSTLGQATTAAIKQFVDELLKATEKVAADVGKAEARQAETTGTVQAVIDSQMFVVNLGTNNGIKMSDTFTINRLQAVKGLKNPVKVPIGTASVVSLEDEAAVLKVESKVKDVQEGDVVALK